MMENLSKQIIAFNRNSVIASLKTPEVPTGERKQLLIELTKELSNFGYIMENDVILSLSKEDMEGIHKILLPHLHNLYHSGETFRYLYPGFPNEVLSKTEEELWQEQHALYDEQITPEDFIKSSPWYTASETVNISNHSGLATPRILKKMTNEEFMRIPTSIMSSGNSLQEMTKKELEWFLKTYPEIKAPEVIPFKETMCIVMANRPEYTPKDINDVLRFSMYVMGSDPALTKVPKKIKKNAWDRMASKNDNWRKLTTLSRERRRNILSMIEKIIDKKGLYNSVVDAKRFYGHWVLLSERVHSGDYASTYPQAVEFFKSLQTKELSKNYTTWYSKIQKLYNTGASTVELTKAISERPGELVRRFDSLLRKSIKSGEESDIMDIFLETDGMRNKTLLELMSYYDRRNKRGTRVVKTTFKGMPKQKVLPTLGEIPDSLLEVVQEMIVRKVLINIDSRITEKDLTGKTVYINKDLKRIPIPKDMRSRTNAIPAGVQKSLPDGVEVIRFFTHWIQEDGKYEDLDLHSILLDENFRSTNQIGYSSSHTSSEKAFAFSGDVRGKAGNCAEYIDIDLRKAVGQGYRYAVMTIKNYEGRGFNTLPCWIGYSVRETMEEGNTSWYPKDVEYCQELASVSFEIAAMLVDLKERKVTFLDTAINEIPSGECSNIFESIAKYYTTEQTFTTFDVVNQHYISRGATVINEIPADKEEFDKVSEFIEANGILHDYVRVLEMIGE